MRATQPERASTAGARAGTGTDPDAGIDLDGDAELAMAAASEAASRALRAGARAPLFTLADAAGQSVALDDLLDAGPVVLHFFRGAWCTFGKRSLTDFATTYQDVLALGANAVAIAPPANRPPMPSAPLPMRELRDVDLKVARAYGLAFELPPRLRARYASLGYRPPATRQADSWLVPVPATYLLERDGTIALAYVDVDYRERVDTELLLTALRALRARHADLDSSHRTRARRLLPDA